MTLTGKKILVTGASRGIGRAIALAFARLGANLMITARPPKEGHGAGALALPEYPVTVHNADLTDEAQLRSLVQACRDRLGGLDVLVNNAGLLLPGKLGMVNMTSVRQMMEINVLSMINLTQYASRLMARNEHGGAIVNLASIAGTSGLEGMSGYSASKASVIGFTLAAAKELAPQGIRVNAIAPGFIDTDMTRQLGGEMSAKALAKIRLGRIGRVEDVANCAAFLASDLSSYITGQVLAVDGGMEA